MKPENPARHRSLERYFLSGFVCLLLSFFAAETFWRLGKLNPASVTGFLLVLGGVFISEDLTCISTGLLAARGQVSFLSGTVACIFAIYFSDMTLYLFGRWLGPALLQRRPFCWWLSRPAFLRSQEWFRHRGLPIVFLARFIPGTRLAVFVSAGILKTPFFPVASLFLLGVLIWVPLVMSATFFFGSRVYDLFSRYESYAIWAAATAIIVIIVLFKLVIPLLNHKGRRLLLSRWLRLSRWEFWPPAIFYAPVVFYVFACLMMRYRSLTLFTAANPGIEHGGWIIDSKYAVIRQLLRCPDFVAKTCLIPSSLSEQERADRVLAFMTQERLDFPVVLKPDVGQRGQGVAIIRNQVELLERVRNSQESMLVQEYIAGAEFGVFYLRYPHEEKGRIFSITEKKMPEVIGDGRRTIEELILDDERAVMMAPWFLKQHQPRLEHVLKEDERFPLVELGSHCRGAVFYDGARFWSQALEDRIDKISRCIEGFYFGRYDIRASTPESFHRGDGFKVIELNGVTSEATHIYDPRYSLVHAYRTLFSQWYHAFAIANLNRRAGTKPASVSALIKAIRKYQSMAALRNQR